MVGREKWWLGGKRWWLAMRFFYWFDLCSHSQQNSLRSNLVQACVLRRKERREKGKTPLEAPCSWLVAVTYTGRLGGMIPLINIELLPFSSTKVGIWLACGCCCCDATLHSGQVKVWWLLDFNLSNSSYRARLCRQIRPVVIRATQPALRGCTRLLGDGGKEKARGGARLVVVSEKRHLAAG